MSDKRTRELLQQNRLLVRQEALAEREVAQIITSMAEAVASRLAYGDVAASLQIVAEFRPAMAETLRRRLQQTAILFGNRTLEGLAEYLPKSAAGAEFPTAGLHRFLEAKDAREVFEGTIFEWVANHALERASSIMATLTDAVRRILTDSFADGTGEAGTAKLIREKVGRDLSATNAARIARTEMHTAANVGQDAAARSTGLEMVKEWASAEDDRVRPTHAQADGQEVALDAAFNVGGSPMMYPGDPAAPAREIIFCRCATLHYPVIGGVVIK